ncbi:nuclease-related domain-containing protein [Lentibacillus sp. N15]|uniref:nuclease-related domain-containing protein n=1 Tax=Lentibacillus songyuanensis TaxID=3136161 RepID=UPI0031BA7280
MQHPIVDKCRDVPIEVMKMETLSNRLKEQHYKKKAVDQKAKNLRAGLHGEESLDFMLSFLPSDSFHILHNLRIRDQSEYFQIDNLISSPKFILINEVKNIAGTVTYDDFGQAVRASKDGEEVNFGNHIEQVNLQHIRLLHWMRTQGLPLIPIEKLVIYSNPATLLKNPANNQAVTEMVIHKEQLLTKIDELSIKHQSTALSSEQLDRLSALLIKAHSPKNIDVMKKFNISRSDIQCGVFCPTCGALPMTRINGSWQCYRCKCISKNAHMPALQDYCFLFGNQISNRAAREFLKVDSTHVMKRILQKAKFAFTGRTTKRFYQLPFY